jgi:hypothetical protein
MPRVLLSINMIVTVSRTLPSTTLGKDVFTKCPIKKHLAFDKEPNSDSEAEVKRPNAPHNLSYAELA